MLFRRFSCDRSSGLSLCRFGWPVANAWLVLGAGEGPILVDSGYPALFGALTWGLARHGFRPEDLRAVLLTHRHSDHAGNARRLSLEHGVPVYAHRLDAEVLAGRSPRPRLTPTTGSAALFAHLENRFPAAPMEALPLEDGQIVLGLEVHHLPGHTAGSVFYVHRPSRTLFTGDMLLSAIPPLTHRTGLSLPYPAYCENPVQALRSLEGFFTREGEPYCLCAGHGPLLRGPILPRLKTLLATAARSIT